jgi:fibronectin type 3 domain-containing protein
MKKLLYIGWCIPNLLFGGSLIVRWEPINNATHYKVTYKDNTSSVISVESTTTNTFTISNTKFDSTYYVSVTAVDDESNESKPSKLISITTKKKELKAKLSPPIVSIKIQQ